MNQKSTLKIEKNKITIVENSELELNEASEYFGVVSGALGDITQALGDTFKALKTVVTVAWDNTFKGLFVLGKNIWDEGGVIKGIKKTNQWLSAENARNIEILDNAVNKQKGAKDMKAFLALAGPGALSFDFLMKNSQELLDKKVINRRSTSGSGKYNKTRRKVVNKKAEISYHNIVMAIYSVHPKGPDVSSLISDNIKVYSSLTSDDFDTDSKVRKTGKEKEIKTLGDDSKKIISSGYFEETIDAIILFSNLTGVEKKQHKLGSGSISKLSAGVIKILEMLKEAEKEGKIISKIESEGIGQDLNSLSNSLIQKQNMKSLRILYKKLHESYNAILKINNNLLLEIENQEEESKQESNVNEELFQEIKKIKVTADVLIPSVKQYEIYYLDLEVRLEVINKYVFIYDEILKFIVSKDNNTAGIEEAKKTKDLENKIDLLNSKVKEYNEMYKSKKPLFDKSSITDYKSFSVSEIVNAHKKIEQNSEMSPEAKELAKAENLLEVFKKYLADFLGKDYVSEVNNILSSSQEIEAAFEDKISRAKPLSIDDKSLINAAGKFDIDKSTDQGVSSKNNLDILKQNVINNYNKVKEKSLKQQELENKIKTYKEEIQKDSSELE